MAEIERQLPRELGFRMPAEWHPHTATWLTWPKDPETWPERVELAQGDTVTSAAAVTVTRANGDVETYPTGTTLTVPD